VDLCVLNVAFQRNSCWINVHFLFNISLNVLFSFVKLLIKQLYQTLPIIILRFSCYQRSSSEVYSILPVLIAIELWRDKNSVVRVAECVAALVVIRWLLTLIPNTYIHLVFLFDFLSNYRSLPIDQLVVVRCMVSQSWFVLFCQTRCPLASGERLVSYGFHLPIMFF